MWSEVLDSSAFEVFEKKGLFHKSSGKKLKELVYSSGNSKNLINAAISAKNKGLKVLGLLGRNGGELLKLVDQNVTIKSNRTCRIQEMHSIIIHIICELFDEIVE